MKNLIVSIVAVMCVSVCALGASVVGSAARQHHSKHPKNSTHRYWTGRYHHPHPHHTKGNGKGKGHKIHFSHHHKG